MCNTCMHTHILMHAHVHVWHAHIHIYNTRTQVGMQISPTTLIRRLCFCSLVLTAAGTQRPPCSGSEQLCVDSKEPRDQQLCVLQRGQCWPARRNSVCTLTVVRPSNVNDLICPFSKKTFRTLGMSRRASFFIIFWEQAVGKGQGEGLI